MFLARCRAGTSFHRRNHIMGWSSFVSMCALSQCVVSLVFHGSVSTSPCDVPRSLEHDLCVGQSSTMRCRVCSKANRRKSHALTPTLPYTHTHTHASCQSAILSLGGGLVKCHFNHETRSLFVSYDA